MEFALIIFFIIAVAIAVKIRTSRRRRILYRLRKPEDNLPQSTPEQLAQYQAHHEMTRDRSFIQKKFITDNESEFLQRLNAALADRFFIFPQVSMGAIIDVAPHVPKDQYWKVKGKYANKIIDYVICDRQCNIKVIIELDDKMHVKERDDARDAMLDSCGYKFIRWDSRNKPSVEEIKRSVLKVVSANA